MLRSIEIFAMVGFYFSAARFVSLLLALEGAEKEVQSLQQSVKKEQKKQVILGKKPIGIW